MDKLPEWLTADLLEKMAEDTRMFVQLILALESRVHALEEREPAIRDWGELLPSSEPRQRN